MIIEFVGLSGSGKSTIARRLSEQSDFQIIKIRKKSELIILNIKFLIFNPFRFFRLLILVIINSKTCKEFYYKFMNCFLDYNAKYQKAKVTNNAILDQGYFQNIISLFNKELSIEDLIEYRKYILVPDKLFIIDANKEIRQSRQMERGYGVRGNFSERENKDFLAVSEKNYRLFLENFKEVFNKAVIVNAEQGVEEVCEELIKSSLDISMVKR